MKDIEIIEVLSFEIWVADYLMTIDQKFLFVKNFDVVHVFGINRKRFRYVLG